MSAGDVSKQHIVASSGLIGEDDLRLDAALAKLERGAREQRGLVDMVGIGLIIPVMPSLLQSLTGESVERTAEIGGWLLFQLYNLWTGSDIPIAWWAHLGGHVHTAMR